MSNLVTLMACYVSSEEYCRHNRHNGCIRLKESTQWLNKSD